MAKHKYILSIDGGGIRGILPLIHLVQLEKQIGKPCREVFSMIAGTSSGGITTAGLVAGVPAQKLLAMISEHAKDIFPSYLGKSLKRLTTGHMYQTEPLKHIIAETLGSAADWKLKDVPIDILISAKRLQDGRPWYFVRDHAKNSSLCSEVSLVDIAVASAAAPTFFTPMHVPDIKRSPKESLQILDNLFVDGGVGVAGNPVYQAAVEAYYYMSGYDHDQTTIVSFGTGKPSFQKPLTWLVPWVLWIINELLDSPWEQQTELINRHFPKTKLVRIEPDLSPILSSPDEFIDLDDAAAADRLMRLPIAETDWGNILS